MRLTARASGTVRAVVLALTIVFAALVLVLGRGDAVDTIILQEGDPSPQDFIATYRVEVVDDTGTEVARQAAARTVEEVYTQDSQTAEAVLRSIQDFFVNVEMVAEPLEIPTIPTDPTITTTSTTTTTEAPTTTTAEGSDTTAGDDTTTSSTTTPTTTTVPPTKIGRASCRERV